MEIILAIVVAAAVIFFGALISIGNDRQRRAIDGLREQTVLWAMQDLKIKRESLARNVRVDDPIGWLNIVTAKVVGHDLHLKYIEAFDEPCALVCVSGDSGSKIVFTLLSPADLLNIKSNRRNRLIQFSEQNPLLSLPRGITVYEVSVLNVGILFDLELPLAWKGLTGQSVELSDRLWVIEYP